MQKETTSQAVACASHSRGGAVLSLHSEGSSANGSVPVPAVGYLWPKSRPCTVMAIISTLYGDYRYPVLRSLVPRITIISTLHYNYQYPSSRLSVPFITIISTLTYDYQYPSFNYKYPVVHLFYSTGA